MTRTMVGVLVAAACGVAVLPPAAGAQEPSPRLDPADSAPLRDARPVAGQPGREAAAPARETVADVQVESTVLGFAPGIGPAVGRNVAYNGKPYIVSDVFAADGAPCFSGGSRFTIALAGGRLVVGLRSAAPRPLNVAALE